RRKAVAAVQDFAIGPAHPERPGVHQNGAIRLRRFGDFLEPRRAGDAGRNGDCAHRCPRIASIWIALAAANETLGACSGAPGSRAQFTTQLFTPDDEKCSAGRKRKSDRRRYRSWWAREAPIWKPSDVGDGQSRKATFPRKAPIPIASLSPTRPHASLTPRTVMRT